MSWSSLCPWDLDRSYSINVIDVMDEMDRYHQVSPFATVGNIFAYAHYTESERNL